MKKAMCLLLAGLFTVSLAGCGSSEKDLQTIFEDNGYTKYESNYRKDKSSTEYILFCLSDDPRSSWLDITYEDNNSSYYFNDDIGRISYCQYDFKTSSTINDSTCTDDELRQVKEAKAIFEEELKTLDITIDDLNKK